MVMFGAVLCVPGYGAMAQPDTSCDPALMQSMEARAWMETDREVVQTHNLMTRHDSVLEYSCFDQLVSLAGEIPADIFSDNETRWLLSTGGLPTISNISTDIALQEVTGIALFTYLFTNYGHRFLGDRTPVVGAAASRAPRTYDCGALDYVWEKAKCMDFGEFQDTYTPGRTDFDLFFDFAWYEGNDPRDLPEAMTACTAYAAWSDARETAFNDSNPDREGSRYVLPVGEETLFDGSDYDVEQAQPAPSYSSAADLYVEYIVEHDHSLFGECRTIQTGITVTRTVGSFGSDVTYQDATCPNPQCHFDQSACVWP